MSTTITVAPSRAEDPSPARIASVVSAFVFANATVFLAAQHVAGEINTALGLLVSIGGGFLAALLIGSLGEWVVHRYVMHRRLWPRPLNLAYDCRAAVAQGDLEDIRSKKFTSKPETLQYLLIAAAGKLDTPDEGYKLLVVLPGGDGSEDFLPFVKRIYKHALSDEYLVLQLLAPKWNNRQQIVWPAAYAASLSKNTPVTGSFVAMSVFKPRQLPDLGRAKGKRYYILHSPEDEVCPYRMAVSAREELREHGAAVELTEYPGGHGWRGNVFGNIRTGIDWLEANAE